MDDILMIVAVLPPLYLAYRVYRMDKVEREPLWLIVLLLFGGGLVTFAAGGLESGFSAVLDYAGLSYWTYQIIKYFIGVAVIEEFCKFIVGKFLTWNSREFNFTFDGVVYMVASSLGFALVENVMYAFMYGMQTALVRAFTAIVLHAVCGIFLGCYYGAARLEESAGNHAKSASLQVRGFILAVAAHGTYDLCATQTSMLFNAAYILLLIGLVAIATVRINKMENSDTYIPYRDKTGAPGPEDDFFR